MRVRDLKGEGRRGVVALPHGVLTPFDILPPPPLQIAYTLLLQCPRLRQLTRLTRLASLNMTDGPLAELTHLTVDQPPDQPPGGPQWLEALLPRLAALRTLTGTAPLDMSTFARVCAGLLCPRLVSLQVVVGPSSQDSHQPRDVLFRVRPGIRTLSATVQEYVRRVTVEGPNLERLSLSFPRACLELTLRCPELVSLQLDASSYRAPVALGPMPRLRRLGLDMTSGGKLALDPHVRSLIRSAAVANLRALSLGCIDAGTVDVLQAHWPPGLVALDLTMDELLAHEEELVIRVPPRLRRLTVRGHRWATLGLVELLHPKDVNGPVALEEVCIEAGEAGPVKVRGPQHFPYWRRVECPVGTPVDQLQETLPGMEVSTYSTGMRGGGRGGRGRGRRWRG
ncbi:hypothetical protein PAPYR_2538 [Paratrimastix pyriformis]|uniref:Uncharacterized protein n=1 Tax=Paratrimastix pyriformis TaxID=342808 RepID=A0ABQ8UQH6_9EUKA|nr:hypothetical protein PAPYR_2538 [Paratrimastix pyriformis]